MSAEIWTIVGVGVALLTLGWLAFNSLRQELVTVRQSMHDEIATVRERLAGVEKIMEMLVKGLHIEIQGRGNA